MQTVKIYTTGSCPYCIQAKQLLKERGIAVLNAAPYSGGVLAKGSAPHKRYVYQEASTETLEPERFRNLEVGANGAAGASFTVAGAKMASGVENR